MAQVIDWELAATTAARLGGAGPRVSYDEAVAAVTQLRRLAEEAAGHVATFTGLTPASEPAPVRVVDRPDWAAANVAGLREVIGPMVQRLAGDRQSGPVAAKVGARAAGVQAGTVLAYLSSRVLGQYEVFGADPGQLLLVAPNIVDVGRKLRADPRDFGLWVCLHEVTHRTQFTAVPWMRGYFLDQVQEFLAGAPDGLAGLRDRLQGGLSAVSDIVRDREDGRSVVELVATDAQRVVLDRITALMTLLEGHAEYVMDEVGPEVIPSVASIRARFDQRRRTANPIARAVRRLLGVDVKLRQYAQGRQFVAGVAGQVGMAGLNRVWESPQTLPLLGELTAPAQWVARVHGAAAAA